MNNTKTSVFILQTNDSLDFSKYWGFIDLCISIITCDQLLILVEIQNTLFQAKNKAVLFTNINDLLNTLYTLSETSKKKHNKIPLDVNILFNGWCGYDLFSEPINWDKIYLIKDDKYLIDRIPSYINSYVLVLEEQVIKSFPIKRGFITNTEQQGLRLDINKGADNPSYKYVAVGGTFDHLHVGHKILLTMTAWITDEWVVCGVTDKILLKNKRFSDWIEPIEARIESVRRFFYLINRTIFLSVTPIYDIYGVTVVDERVGAIVVSEETIRGGEMINEERKARGMKELDIFCINIIVEEEVVIGGESISIKISSTNIREEIARRRETV
ncbi:hypothetical protein T552_02864 [Pneumocystis carinii B80]|uniref:Cytidyltransferase-like domain-containing protein n=1 Tax=Pneumocystis carinii (strain B80) TaxID=1408658 RepID=A0A0W4ZDJ9_PNEC8|nr:hypothetical protein T552_02864 [Pneumocystis carinii B80]KTW26382.1 hypothetical protein T552_02864 [Pneumocystis carinii B80]